MSPSGAPDPPSAAPVPSATVPGTGVPRVPLVRIAGPGGRPATAAARAVAGHLAVLTAALATVGIALGHLRHHEHVPGAPMPRGPLQGLPHVHSPDHATLLWILVVAYVAALVFARSVRLLPLLLVVVALDVLLALTPPRPLTDLFSYVSYGRMLGEHGIDPYLTGPRAIAGDPSFPYVAPDWYDTPTVYGPVFTGLSAAVSSLGTLGAAWALKGVAAISAAGATVFVALAARRTDERPGSGSAAAVLLGLNPLLLAYGVGGGHNDVLMVLPLAAGLWLLARRTDVAGAALATVAPAIKLSAGLALPFLLAGERRPRVLLGVVGTTVVVLAGTLVAFGTAPFRATGLIGTHTADGHRHSVPAYVASRLGSGVPSDATFRGLLIGAGVVAVLLLVATALRRIPWTTGAAIATALVVATAGTSFAWYAVWALPLAAARPRRTTAAAVVLLTVLFVGMQTAGRGPL
ncbi:polyprenol phosphomannose-dependent alpha 1,6 mannosyltransferase MptB [Patulibacter minatonensis]|uniref:polyprenol phosphomannose-dependent alpha 1,6 mannosyltransferase MptB n=1 Tax=Patulibacter minatonensis TaxID=298163 RepID=UPI0012FA3305|nr:polyprenol phosphomannose-dependent alpha 1,6 mannosyltransferase MptB [Patulibacter minatonensis]